MNKIDAIAKKVRKAMEHYSRDLGDDYFISPKDLGGGCGIASVALAKLLIDHGIKAEVVVSNQHCWVETKKTFIDVTATQFGHKEKVLRRKPRDATYIEEIRFAPTDRMHRTFFPWSKPQKPTNRIIKKIIKLSQIA